MWINLAWRNKGLYELIEIKRKMSSNPYIKIAMIPGSSTVYVDKPPAKGMTYTYKIRAWTKAGGYSKYSNAASITTPKRCK